MVSFKDKFYILLATLQLNCMKIRLEVLTTATTILLPHTKNKNVLLHIPDNFYKIYNINIDT